MKILSRWLTQAKNGRALEADRQPGESNSWSTLVVTHAELSSRHGTGALLARILRHETHLVAFYSREFFESHDIEVAGFPIKNAGSEISGARKQIRQLLEKRRIERILCVPFYEDEVRSALAAREFSGAPLALYIMDDQNIHVKEISDSLMRSLIRKANICFGISPALCGAYEAKYQRKFWFIPPVADPDLFVPPDYHFTPNLPPHGILIGNLWSSHTLTQFRDTVRSAGFRVDWYGNAGRPFIKLNPEELAKEGIYLHAHVPEPALIASARNSDFAVIPAGTLDGSDTHDWLARASLPSRIIYLMATANVPMIVMGHPETAAAQFVVDLGLGTACDYSADSFSSAVKSVTTGAASAKIRSHARELSRNFSSEGLSDWLWESASRGHAIDNRFEMLLPQKRSA
ncbi:MAG: hypothetical protein WAK31_11935 [Chthoniobacterales bacterium]